MLLPAVKHDPTIYNAETSSNSVAEEENTVTYNSDGTVETVGGSPATTPSGDGVSEASSLTNISAIALWGLSLVVVLLSY